ncbi:MDR family MFS transporter [Lactiplantibacillus daowaiensis]|uniref:MDR family MFS transporter n=1 Tax=Lactiplantibacillus daowaiensis TaxID=2559918 RepID=A0ABW1S3S9_9LACO
MKKENQIPKSVMVIALVIVFGAMAPLLDSTMMNIAINAVVKDFNSSVTTVQWTVTCYLLATGVAVPFSSWLLNKFDGKFVFMAGELLFGIGSLLSAMAPSVQLLISARLVQGFAGGLIMPLLTVLLVRTSGTEVMGQMMAIVGVPMILGPLVGPIIGGVIIKLVSWRWIFWVNVPVVLISIALIAWKMPHYPAQDKQAKMDVIGIMCLVLASSALIYGIVNAAHSASFTNQTSVMYMGLGLAMFVLYIIWAVIRQERAVLPLNLFKFSSFDGASLGLFLAGTVLNGAMLLLPLYFQDIQKMSVLTAALALVPQGLGMMISRGVTGRLTDQIGAKYVVLASVAITFIGTLPFYWFDQHTAYWLIAIVLLVRGMGAGGIIMPLMADAYTGMRVDQVPAATIGARIIQNIGSAFGSALVTTVVTSYITSQVQQVKASALASQAVAIRTTAFQNGFLLVSIAALVIMLPTLLLTNKMKA